MRNFGCERNALLPQGNFHLLHIEREGVLEQDQGRSPIFPIPRRATGAWRCGCCATVDSGCSGLDLYFGISKLLC